MLVGLNGLVHGRNVERVKVGSTKLATILERLDRVETLLACVLKRTSTESIVHVSRQTREHVDRVFLCVSA